MAKVIDTGLWDRLVFRQHDEGGINFIDTGIMGSGKTSLLFTIARVLLKRNNPPERLFWRGTFACEFIKFSPSQILVDRKIYPLKIYEGGKLVTDIEQIPFDNFSELFSKADPRKLNVVYMADELRKWTDFLCWLLEHNDGWASLFLDEVSEIVPAYQKGKLWSVVGNFGESMVHTRKMGLSIYSATQYPTKVDWRFMSNIMAYGFLPGAKKVGVSSLYQNAINKLKVGSAYLAMGGLFMPVDFDAYPPKRRIVIRGLRQLQAPAKQRKKGFPDKARKALEKYKTRKAERAKRRKKKSKKARP